MNLSPKIIGFIKIVAGVALWGAADAALSFLGDASHLQAIIHNPLVVTLIVGIAGALEEARQHKTGTALLGVVGIKSPVGCPGTFHCARCSDTSQL